MSSAPAGSGNSGMGMNTVTTVMAFSVSAFFVLFVFTRLLCARIHLRTAAAEQAAAAHASNAAFPFPTITVERGIHGVEPSVVTAFPMVKLGDDSLAPPAQELSQCTVCLEECQAKDVVRVLPYCGHAFHLACIDTWLRQHSTCPICRASMRGATAKHRAATDMAPVYYAVAMARPAPPFQFQVATSSSDSNAVQVEVEAEPAAAAPVSDHADVPASRLEIVSDEALVSSGAACPSAAPSPSATEYPCSASVTTRQSPQGNASEHC